MAGPSHSCGGYAAFGITSPKVFGRCAGLLPLARGGQAHHWICNTQGLVLTEVNLTVS